MYITWGETGELNPLTMVNKSSLLTMSSAWQRPNNVLPSQLGLYRFYSPSWLYSVEYSDCFSAGVRPPPNECPAYDTKQSDAELPVMLGLWGMQSISSLPRVVAPERALSMG